MAHGPVLHVSYSRVHALLLLHLHRNSPAGRNSFTTLCPGYAPPELNLDQAELGPALTGLSECTRLVLQELCAPSSPGEREGSHQPQCTEHLLSISLVWGTGAMEEFGKKSLRFLDPEKSQLLTIPGYEHFYLALLSREISTSKPES